MTAEQIIWWVGSVLGSLAGGYNLYQIWFNQKPKLIVDLNEVSATEYIPSMHNDHPGTLLFNGQISNPGKIPVTIKKVLLECKQFKGIYGYESLQDSKLHSTKITNNKFNPNDSYHFSISYTKRSEINKNKITGIIKFIDINNKIRFKKEFNIKVKKES